MENILSRQAEYRKLPSVDALLQNPQVALLSSEYGQAPVVSVARDQLALARCSIAEGGSAPIVDQWPNLLVQQLEKYFLPTLVPTINATGVILHTNLGRAPLSQASRWAVQEIMQGYSNLEYDLDKGQRGSRYEHVRDRLCRLTGAEDALVVNNNAAAIYLVLAALCHKESGRICDKEKNEVVVSRGQLVEIGGGFRIPDVLRQSGAKLVEVGTTNRTHVQDFADAITPQTVAFMRIHSSNFRQFGFVSQPSLADLVEVAHNKSVAMQNCSQVSSTNHPVIVIDDQGSGTLIDTVPYGLCEEPLVQDSIAHGTDIVTFSGDKLLGGPQAGLIVGKKELIAIIRRYPLMRALRVDKMTLAALEATLLSYEQGLAVAEIPIWQMISATAGQLQERVQQWQNTLIQNFDADFAKRVHIWTGESAVGGGSLPGETLPTWLLALSVDQLDKAAAYLRQLKIPVICRIQNEYLICDPRTVLPGQDDLLIAALTNMLKNYLE